MVPSKKLLILVVILAVFLVPRFFLTEVRTVIADSPVKALPERIAEWEGEETPVPTQVKEALPEGTEFMRKWYREGDSRESGGVLVTVVISGTDRRSIHRPERCLPAQGWQLVSRDRWPVSVSSGGKRNLDATRLVLRQAPRGEEIVVFYWFMSGKDLTGSNLERVLLTWRDRVFRGLNYRWSYALLISGVERSVSRTSEGLAGFASQLLPAIWKRAD